MNIHEAEEKTKGFLHEFKKFAMRGNVIDLAVGVIIGGAFGKIVTSIVNDVLMPLIGLVIGKVDFKKLFLSLDGKEYPSLEAAAAAKAPVLAYGSFLQNVLDFVIIAFVIFMVVRQLNKVAKPQGPPPTPTTKDCPFCCTVISLKATRCPQCTSQLS
jgi:large conductance mechanosensitive channel